MALLKHPSPPFLSMVFFLLLTLSSALDMSIIDHNLRQEQIKTEAQITKMYEMWLVKHGKAYNALGEKEKRFEIFKDNLKFIEEHNSVNRTYKVGLNRFADMTNEEYRAMYLGARVDGKTQRLEGKKTSDRLKNF
ncbi:Peptidase C1A, papain [Corchorus capsularis]|uniref:Peptidase C1A, papain n=1 Tax=Corchorus capsularis TaxID=210143 RepID=A0A1R3HUE4_COCAP|nr:Peptidase C1A, papain [Corchorus capsularis]